MSRPSIPGMLQDIKARERRNAPEPLVSTNGWALYRYDLPLLDVVQALHQSETESGDIIAEEYKAVLKLWLEARLASWEPSVPDWTQNYDTAVRLLAESVLIELNRT